jgi:hypothetical protein
MLLCIIDNWPERLQVFFFFFPVRGSKTFYEKKKIISHELQFVYRPMKYSLKREHTECPNQEEMDRLNRNEWTYPCHKVI